MRVHTRRDMNRSRAPQRPALQPGALAFRAIYATTGRQRQCIDTPANCRPATGAPGVLGDDGKFPPVFAPKNSLAIRRVSASPNTTSGRVVRDPG